LIERGRINDREYWRTNQKWTIQRNWQHRAHKTKKCANFQNFTVFLFHPILMQFLWSDYINGLLMGHNKNHFISESGLIGAQIPNGLCRVLSVVCQQIPLSTLIFLIWSPTLIWGIHGCVEMVVGFSTTCAISAYNHWSCEFESWGALNTTFCDQVWQWFAIGRWFYLGTHVS